MYGGCKIKEVKAMVEALKVQTQQTVKYLGVVLECNLTMTDHVKACSTKSERTAMVLV